MGGPGSGPRAGGSQGPFSSSRAAAAAGKPLGHEFGIPHSGEVSNDYWKNLDATNTAHEAIKSGGGRGPTDATSHISGPAGHTTTATNAAPMSSHLSPAENKALAEKSWAHNAAAQKSLHEGNRK